MSVLCCDRCGEPFESPGAIVYSLPVDGKADKINICPICWKDLFLFIYEYQDLIG